MQKERIKFKPLLLLMEEIRLTRWYVKYPIMLQWFTTIPGGDRRISEPSTVVTFLKVT